MPVDTKIIKPFGKVTKSLIIGKGPKNITLETLDPHKLRDLLAKEKVAKKGSNIVFIDCQSFADKGNTGSQIHGAIHIDMVGAHLSQAKFNAVIKAKPDVYNKIGGAELVVIYCSYGSLRSPTIMALYEDAVSDVDTRPLVYNDDQYVLLLEGGIHAYEAVKGEVPYLEKYVGMHNGKAKTVSSGGSGKLPQLSGDDHCDIY
ncbi:uncharacterized protein N7482_010154 [Penicillium canariense]|uniref:Uncharacterized protein n=1 Tax=Penicillium canariense TaxID=189055 RepID=A0A9W9HK97_9EURO|nr:uncharacterized protein N7482_010154 [Penicillium canariense]KAJ5150902.1 hypothetical protein N7482_010154 [Penicillium canariense]